MVGFSAAGLVRPLAACLLVGALAACGQSPQQPVTHAASASGEWVRPTSYDPPGPASDPWGPYIQAASRRFDVPERWIREVMRQESAGRVAATSRVGAMGLMQVMPGTYRELQARYGLGPDPYHPWDNLMAGTAYVREMYQLYGAPAFLAAYNAGPRRLEDYLWGGRGLPNETRNYVARVGPRIAGIHPNRRAAPEVYAAAEIPFDIPVGPRRGDAATMLALREQRRAVDPGIQVATLPAGPVVRMDPIPDGSTTVASAFSPPAAPARTQVASASGFAPVGVSPAGSVVAMAPIASPGDFQTRMEPIESPGDRVTRMDPVASAGDPGVAPIRTESLAPPPASRALAAAPVPATRGFSLIPQAHAGTLPAVPRQVAAAPAGGGAWGIQVGAFASENLARAAAGQARDQVGASGTRALVEPSAQGRSTLFRARVVGLSSRGAAEQACERLRGRGACMIVAPGV
ncbi:transglycosylase SLT domain-containing protein [Falsiroseomonas sp.]|uniref:transglycosylase SLT domain-containing protein n=1 Tax=Falsiroseomonas sp. TaxID=2870721 RepID=UPI003F704AB5